MPEHTFHFLGGLPRSGSTLLCNILAQNPRVHATQTSACMDVMFGVRNNWDKLIEHKAHPMPQAKQRVLRGILKSYYADVSRPVVIDKCRGWVSLLEMAELALDRPAKIIIPVRDLRDVLASFERLWREQAASGQINGESENYFRFQTTEGRIAHWIRDDQPVGLAYNRIRDAVTRFQNQDLLDRLHFVPFERLTTDPTGALADLYRFLGEPVFEHDFEQIEQVTTEDDSVFGFQDLHTIRGKVEPIAPRWPEVLGDIAQRYGGLNFWRPIVQEQIQRFTPAPSDKQAPIGA
ncbi:MAG: sulfotransferase [Planctomycetota bacterium]